MKRLATVYERRGRIFVSAEAKTRAGFWVTQLTGRCRPRPPLHALAATVLHALARSGGTVPTSPPSESPAKPLLQLARVKTYATFARGAKAVTVSQEESGITVVPMHNGGSRTGFTELDDRAWAQTPIRSRSAKP
jgi:hypothetical protein